MANEIDKRQRRTIRLDDYDYQSAGAYFATICTHERMCVLDDPIVSGIIGDVWHALPRRFPTIALDEFVVMPNHIHLIVWLHVGQGQIGRGKAPPLQDDDVEATPTCSPPLGGAVAQGTVAREWAIPDPTRVNANPKLGDVIGAFKLLVTKVYLGWIEAHDPTRSASFWQRNYYEHIVRSERELLAIRQYVIDNPMRWELDLDNPLNIRHRPPATGIGAYLNDIAPIAPHKSSL